MLPPWTKGASGFCLLRRLSSLRGGSQIGTVGLQRRKLLARSPTQLELPSASWKQLTGSGRVQNRQFDEAVRQIEAWLGRKLTDAEIERLHREISKGGYDLDEIVQIGIGLFGSP